jgi:hypothetical protein
MELRDSDSCPQLSERKIFRDEKNNLEIRKTFIIWSSSDTPWQVLDTSIEHRALVPGVPIIYLLF